MARKKSKKRLPERCFLSSTTGSRSPVLPGPPLEVTEDPNWWGVDRAGCGVGLWWPPRPRCEVGPPVAAPTKNTNRNGWKICKFANDKILMRKACISFQIQWPKISTFWSKTITKKLETEYVRPVKTCNLHQVEGKSKILGHCIWTMCTQISGRNFKRLWKKKFDLPYQAQPAAAAAWPLNILSLS